MSNATIATPVSKLYRMCGKYNAHGKCAGHFDNADGTTYSVCACECHVRKSEATTKPKTVRARKTKATPVVVEQPKVDARLQTLAEWLVKADAYMGRFTSEEVSSARDLAITLKAAQ